MIRNASTLPDVTWRPSSYSNSEGNCIEIAEGAGANGKVPVRDSKNPTGPALCFSPSAFAVFVSAVKGGEFTAGERYVSR